MNKLFLTVLIWLFSYSVFAADNTVTLTPGSGVTMRTKDIGSGVQSPYNILGDTSGVAIYGTAGTANANVLTVQGIASGTSLNVTVTNANANGQAVLASSSPVAIAKNSGTGSTISGAAIGTAGTASTEVVTIQGIASGTVVPVSLTSTTITGTVAATQSGTWTIQPGNTPNTSAWLNTLIPTSATAGALTTNTCGSAASSCVLKASAGSFYGAYAECTSACWLMVFNATSAPSNGSTTAGTGSGNLVECIDISANGSKSINYPTFPRAFSVGVTVAISSTACATLTLSTVGFVSGSVM